MKTIALQRLDSEARKHHLIGNALCLDFANTLYGHTGKPLHEYLDSFYDLVIWCQKAGILGSREANRLAHLAELHPNEARVVFHRAIALREIIYRIFAAQAAGGRPPAEDLVALNAARSDALAHTEIRASGGGFRVTWLAVEGMERILWPIAISAGDLITSENLRRVRQCSGETCDWLFLDTSRNHMRRWCSMSVCGNRTKVRRFMERRRPHTRP